ncbi:hypothetical protein [Tenacibaculum maritimum]|uniref:hypothetical protein n=1 Tax=Tenacibaculum maritimum TaxID=107401 RepID=UPI0003F5E15F|nr:hypothetical protein [Tenacibaculum maritimum]CAA0260633.1 conserved hypothetical protein [Tenacibaculum maritimum]
MPADTVEQLKQKIKAAYDKHSDKDVNPAIAREELADDIAKAVEAYIVGRLTVISGNQGIIQ